MIDSMYIDFAGQFSILDDNLLVVDRTHAASYGEEPIYEKVLWLSSDKGNEVRGRRAYFRRTKHFPVDIDIKIWRDGKVHCLVKFSIPELLHGNNFKLISHEDLMRGLQELKEVLAIIGLIVEPVEGTMIRLDLIHQSAMATDFRDYARLLRRLNVPGTNQMEYDSSFLWLYKNQWGISVYDKYAQMEIESTDAGFLRIEIQLRRREIIERVIGSSNVSDLLKQFDSLPNIYRSFLKKRLIPGINPSLGDVDSNFPFLSFISHIKDETSERWRALSLEQIGLIALCKEIGLSDAVDHVCGEGKGAASTVRSRRSRMTKRAREALNQYEALKLMGDSHFKDEIKKVINHLESFASISASKQLHDIPS